MLLSALMLQLLFQQMDEFERSLEFLGDALFVEDVWVDDAMFPTVDDPPFVSLQLQRC